MTKLSDSALKDKFQLGDVPDDQDFADLIDSKLNLIQGPGQELTGEEIYSDTVIWEGDKAHLWIDDALGVGSVPLELSEQHAAFVANGGKVIYPQHIANQLALTRYPVDSHGIPVTDTATMSLAGMYDFGEAFDIAYYEMVKNPGSIMMITGIMKTSRPFYVPPAGGVILGRGRGCSIIYSSPDNGDFLYFGDKYVPELALPITSRSDDGVNTTFTVDTTGAKRRLAGGVNQAGAPTAPWTDLPAECDPWGQWLGEFGAFGFRDSDHMSSMTNYERADIYEFDQDARTVTVKGLLDFDAGDYICTPALNPTTGAYDVADSHPRHRYELIRDVGFNGRQKGKMYIGYGRGIKGRPDPSTSLERVSFNRFFSLETDFESDSNIKNLSMSQPKNDGPTISSIDSTWEDIKFTSTQGIGMTVAKGMDQTVITGKSKGYYLSKDAADLTEARSVYHEGDGGGGAAGLSAVGRFIIEDTAGAALYFSNQCNNIHYYSFELNNGGAIGLGSPDTVGGPYYDTDAVRFASDASISDITVHGIVRANVGNRDGQHVRSAWYIDGPNTENYSVTGTPYLFRNIDINLNFVSANYSLNPSNLQPDHRKSLWNSTNAYAKDDIVQIEDTPQAIRYKAKKAVATGGASPDGDHANWTHVGGGRNAWEKGFIIEDFSGDYRPEFWNCTLIINGERDLSYHQRDVGSIEAYTVDPEQDVVLCDQANTSVESRYDVFPGREGRVQIWSAPNASSSKPVVFEPGFRSRATAAISGSIGTLSRDGSEMKIEHRSGKVHFVAHSQVETVADSTLTLDLSDFGKTIQLSYAGGVTVTAPGLSTLPDDWYVDLVVLDSAGSVTFSSPTVGTGILAQYGYARLRKTGSVIVQV